MSKKKGGGLGDEFKQEDFLQAIVVVDNFERTFGPITLDKPRALLPLVNAPLIEYTLECLNASGVQLAIIYCCTNAEMVKSYFRGSKWTSGSSASMGVRLVVAEECMSVGDVLRDVENKSLVKSDFLLVSGDLVSNVKLLKIVEEHRQRRKVSKNAIMTMVYKQCSSNYPSRSNRKDIILAIESKTQHIVGYQKVGVSKKFRLPLSVFDAPVVQLRSDLLDCHIAVCSTVVPQLMTDNFDFQTIDDFIRGILVSEEILDNTLHVHVLSAEEYAVSVTDPSMYDTVSQDVMNRRTYPLTPDSNILGSHSSDNRYVGKLRNVYQHRDVALAYGCRLDGNVTVGKGCHVDEGSTISRTVLGRNCHIGRNVRIEGCYLWDGVRVGDGSVLTDSIIESDVQIGSGVRVGRFCIVGRNVIISSDRVLVSRSFYVTRATLDALTTDVYDLYKKKYVPFDNGKDSTTLRYMTTDDGLDSGWASGMDRDDGDDDGEDKSSDDSGDDLGRVDNVSVTDDFGDDDDDEDEEDDEDDDVVHYLEVVRILKRAINKGIDTDNVIVEINSIKHAYGIAMRELTMIVIKAFLELPLRTLPRIEPSAREQYLERYVSNFKHFRVVFANYVKTKEGEIAVLFSVESFSRSSPLIPSVYPKLLMYLYNENVISEEAIEAWWATEDDEECNEDFRKTVEPFVKWLEAAEEESD